MKPGSTAVRRAASSLKSEPMAIDRQRHPSSCVLIADEDHTVARRISQAASDLGWASATIANLPEFEERYRELGPTTIVANLFLPHFDGIDMTRWLIAEGNRAPLFLMSHRGRLFARAAEALAHNAGFPVHYLAKPLTESALQRMLSADRNDAILGPGCALV